MIRNKTHQAQFLYLTSVYTYVDIHQFISLCHTAYPHLCISNVVCANVPGTCTMIPTDRSSLGLQLVSVRKTAQAARALGTGITRPGQRKGWTRGTCCWGADFGDRCHFSNLTRVKIERRQAVSWCDSAAVAEHRAAVAAALRLRENHAGMSRGRRHPLRAAQSRAALPQGRRQRPGPCPCGAETAGCERQRRHVRCGQASAQPLAPCLLRAAGPRVPGPAPAPHGSEAQQGRGAPGGM